MNVPSGLHLFSPHWYEPVDLTTQLERLPPVDAPCMCMRDRDCRFPFCEPPPLEEAAPPP